MSELVINRDLPTPRPVAQAMRRGFGGKCPHCGRGRMFRAFLKTADTCSVCGEELHHHRADDAPPYVTIVLVGHLLVPFMVPFMLDGNMANWTVLAIFLPLTAVAALVLLQPVKGAIVGLQWALRMHGFDPDGNEANAVPAVAASPG